MSKNMIKAGNMIFKIVRVCMVLVLVAVVIYAASVVIRVLYPNLNREVAVFLREHGLAQAFSTSTLTLTGTTPTPTTNPNGGFGIGTGVSPSGTGPISTFTQPVPLTPSTNQNFTYVPLAPINNVTSVLNNQPVGAASGSTFIQYIQAIYKLGIGLCATLAVVMIIYGGFLYVVSEGFGSKSNAKEIITGAVEGLVLALCIYIIAHAVNQDLLSGSFFNDFKVANDSISTTPITADQPLLRPGDPGYPFQSGQQGYGSLATAQGQVYSGTPGTFVAATPGSVAANTQAGTTFPSSAGISNDQVVALINQSGILNLSPSDAANFFPGGVPTAQGYASLLASIASKESDYNPNDITSNDVGNTDSVGLLSLSPQDSVARQLQYSEQDLLNPSNNIQAGIQILMNQIQSGGCISCGSSGNWKGGAAYWSTLRSSATNNGNGG